MRLGELVLGIVLFGAGLYGVYAYVSTAPPGNPSWCVPGVVCPWPYLLIAIQSFLMLGAGIILVLWAFTADMPRTTRGEAV